MTATTEYIDYRPALATLRLRLKPAHRSCGYVQGAWWPRSTSLAAELPPLLEALSLRFGAIDRVRCHQNDWLAMQPDIKHRVDGVVFDAGADSPNVITVFGTRFGKLSLLVIPPCTDTIQARAAMTTAASVDDSSTPDQLLGLDDYGAKGRRHAVIALQRWESEGGALCALA